jgi:hypothetical protein
VAGLVRRDQPELTFGGDDQFLETHAAHGVAGVWHERFA